MTDLRRIYSVVHYDSFSMEHTEIAKDMTKEEADLLCAAWTKAAGQMEYYDVYPRARKITVHSDGEGCGNLNLTEGDCPMKSITKEQALKLANNKFWEGMTFRQRAEFQMETELLCMPFEVLHEAVEKTLGRPVYTHEFGLDYEGLRKELRGERPAPSFEEVVNLIPEDKRLILAVAP